MNRRDLFRLAGAVAVAPRAMLAAPVVAPPQFMSGVAMMQAMYPARGFEKILWSRSALLAAMPERSLLIDGLHDEDDEDDADGA